MIRDFVKSRAAGFGMVEVLVSLIIIAVGMLGIAKIQALAFSSTGVARMRSLAAIQAASLAATMHADKAYWAAGLEPVSTTINGAVISDPGLATPANCTTSGTAPCTPTILAAYDVQQWASGLNILLPNSVAVIACPVAAAGVPVSCTIQISWSENLVSINSQGVNGPAMQAPTYTLYIEP